MKTFKCEAMGDTIYFNAVSLNEAKDQFTASMGDDLPDSMLRWSEVSVLPHDEDYMPDMR